MIVTTLNYNPFYFKQLRVMLSSLQQNASREKIFVVLVDFPLEILEILQKIFSSYIFENRNLNVHLKPDIPGFMVCYRSIIIKEALEKFKEPIAWFDTDLLIRNRLYDFWDGVETNQLKIQFRNEKKEKSKFQAGVFAIGYSPETINYITEWNNTIQNENEWYSDQLHLYKLYQKHSSKLYLIRLHAKYNDHFFNKKNIIWHCKRGHFDEPLFQEDFQKYLKMTDEYFNKMDM